MGKQLMVELTVICMTHVGFMLISRSIRYQKEMCEAKEFVCEQNNCAILFN